MPEVKSFCQQEINNKLPSFSPILGISTPTPKETTQSAMLNDTSISAYLRSNIQGGDVQAFWEDHENLLINYSENSGKMLEAVIDSPA